MATKEEQLRGHPPEADQIREEEVMGIRLQEARLRRLLPLVLELQHQEMLLPARLRLVREQQ